MATISNCASSTGPRASWESKQFGQDLRYLVKQNGVEITGRQVAECDQIFHLATRHLPQAAIVATENNEVCLCDVTLSVYPHRAGLKNMPGHGGNRTYDLWNTSPTLCQLSYAVRSVRVCDISELSLVPSISV